MDKERAKNTIEIKDIKAGMSYACHFEAYTMLTVNGKPARGQIGESFPGPGTYEGFGLITKRDLKQEKLLITDIETRCEFVVSFDNVWGIDEAEISK